MVSVIIYWLFHTHDKEMSDFSVNRVCAATTTAT